MLSNKRNSFEYKVLWYNTRNTIVIDIIQGYYCDIIQGILLVLTIIRNSLDDSK